MVSFDGFLLLREGMMLTFANSIISGPLLVGLFEFLRGKFYGSILLGWTDGLPVKPILLGFELICQK